MFKKIKAFLFENRGGRQTVAKNTTWLTISNYGGRIIKAAIIIYAARVLDTAGYGVFSYAVTLAGFVGLFLDPGINFILIREASKAPEEKKMAVFSTTFVIKAILVTIGVLIIIFVAPSFSILPGAKILIPIVAIILAFDTFREFFSSLIRSEEKMEWDAAIFLFTNAAVVVFGFIFLMISRTPLALTWAYAIGTVLGGLAAFIFTFPYLKKSLPHFSPTLAVSVFQSAWPFAVIGALGLLLTNTDILIISWMRDASDVGIYAAVIRIVQVFYVIPGIIQTSTMPAFARLAREDKTRFRAGFERTLGFIFLCSVPLAFGGAILGTQVMTLVFGAPYAIGGVSLTVLMFAMVFDFPASVIGSAVFAYDHQKSLIVSSIIAGVSNIVLDLIFIPRFGITGSAFATLIAQALSNWYLWSAMKKINYFKILPRLKRVAVAGIVMGIATAALSWLGVNVVINVGISIVLYFTLLWALKEPVFTEIKGIITNHARA
jgi:O-antigen/teichoic acid export membrane protein